jgi:hypothetical protein
LVDDVSCAENLLAVVEQAERLLKPGEIAVDVGDETYLDSRLLARIAQARILEMSYWPSQTFWYWRPFRKYSGVKPLTRGRTAWRKKRLAGIAAGQWSSM